MGLSFLLGGINVPFLAPTEKLDISVLGHQFRGRQELAQKRRREEEDNAFEVNREVTRRQMKGMPLADALNLD